MRRLLKTFLIAANICTVLIVILIAYDLKLKSEEPAMQAALQQDCIKIKNDHAYDNISQYNEMCGDVTGRL